MEVKIRLHLMKVMEKSILKMLKATVCWFALVALLISLRTYCQKETERFKVF